jgi:hypothetical protein
MPVFCCDEFFQDAGRLARMVIREPVVTLANIGLGRPVQRDARGTSPRLAPEPNG